MKKYYKFAALTLCAAMTFGFASCSDDDTPTTSQSEKDATFEAIATQYVNNVVIVTYTNLANEAETLADQLEALKTNKTQANVNAVCETFLEARAWWEKSEAFLYGAASDFGIDPHIDSWPLDLDGLKDELSNSAHIASMAADGADEWASAHLGPELLGFHGIEYIIFEDGEPKDVDKISDDEIIYAAAVGGDLRNKCYQLEVSWAGSDNVASAHATKVEELELNTTTTGGFSYAENMLMAGQAGSTYTSWAVAMQAIVDGCKTIADEVGTMKIGAPTTGADKNYIESPYSQKSIIDFYDNMVSIENAYMGGIEGQRDESKSIHAYIASVNADLDTRTVAAIENAKTTINNMSAPFVTGIQNNDAAAIATYEAAMEACSDLDDVLSEVKTQLGQ